MRKILWLTIFIVSLSSTGCASLQDFFNVLSGNSAQKITRTPMWVYRPDLRISVDNATFSGVGVTVLPKDTSTVSIYSPINIDRVEISSCSRHDVCQIKGGELACDVRSDQNPNGRFWIESGFWGNPGKNMQYYFRASRKEHDNSCANLMIAVYDKNTLATWGYLVYRADPETNFPARFTCNATDWGFAGVSVCAAKAGTIQAIDFADPVDNYRAEDTCNMKKISDKQFEFQPAVGWCRASFMKNKKFHDVIINGYDEVLLRDGN